jgi:hypothetical protein
MAIFGKEAGCHFDEVNKILNTIFLAANRLGTRHWQDQGRARFTEKQFEEHLKEMHKNEKIVWADLDETDEIANRMNKCISEIETYCIGIMKK